MFANINVASTGWRTGGGKMHKHTNSMFIGPLVHWSIGPLEIVN